MNFTKFLKSLFGDKSSRDMKLIQPFVEQVKAISPQIEKLDNDALRARTQEIRKNIQESANDKRKQIDELKAKIEAGYKAVTEGGYDYESIIKNLLKRVLGNGK